MRHVKFVADILEGGAGNSLYFQISAPGMMAPKGLIFWVIYSVQRTPNTVGLYYSAYYLTPHDEDTLLLTVRLSSAPKFIISPT